MSTQQLDVKNAQLKTTEGVYTIASPSSRYTLFYREGRNPHPQFSFIDFPSSSTIMNVVARAKEFCDKMGYRFVNIQQSVIDMEKEEARRRGE